MRLGATILVWALLLVLLGAELGAAYLPGGRFLTVAIGVGMAVLVSMTFMRLPNTGGLSAMFAMAGAFWLAVLLATGALDPATRHDIPAPQRTEP